METLLRKWFEGLGGSLSVRELEERPTILRPEEAGEVGRGAGDGGGGLAGGGDGGDGPFRPVAGQVLQGIRHGAGSPCERSPEIDVNAFHFYLNLPASTCIYLYILAAVS